VGFQKLGHRRSFFAPLTSAANPVEILVGDAAAIATEQGGDDLGVRPVEERVDEVFSGPTVAPAWRGTVGK
jgi:hypothetical protein